MRFLSKKQVRELISLSYATIDRMEKEQLSFPKRIAIGFRRVWIESEILEWMRARIASRES